MNGQYTQTCMPIHIWVLRQLHTRTCAPAYPHKHAHVHNPPWTHTRAQPLSTYTCARTHAHKSVSCCPPPAQAPMCCLSSLPVATTLLCWCPKMRAATDCNLTRWRRCGWCVKRRGRGHRARHVMRAVSRHRPRAHLLACMPRSSAASAVCTAAGLWMAATWMAERHCALRCLDTRPSLPVCSNARHFLKLRLALYSLVAEKFKREPLRPAGSARTINLTCMLDTLHTQHLTCMTPSASILRRRPHRLWHAPC